MKKDLDGPADTRMMAIVHEALRRDLARTRSALASPVDERRRQAIAAHLDWMMDFLHAHHEGEDTGLYPMVRAADPGSAALLDAMAADHAAIDPAVATLRAATARWKRSDAGRPALLTALADLESVLLPHLDREVAEAMPVVAAAITQRQWQAWDQEHNIKPKSLPRLAEEGNWLLDGASAGDRQVVEAVVPLIPRLIVLHVFGPGYRRRAAARWAPVAVGAAS
jgi:hemerythrin-like domain-containing protein